MTKHIPKAELHVHLEGTARPSLIKELAKKNQVQLPDDIFGPNDTYAWTGFHEFREVYDIASSAIKSGDDFYDIAFAYLKQSAEEGVIYAELIACPEVAEMNNISHEDHIGGISRAIQDAEQEFGIVSRILITAVRNCGVEKAIDLARFIANNPHPLIIGFGLAGDEVEFPPAQFAKAFEIAHEGGLHCHVHAGEISDAQNIWEAIENLPVSRIGHGVHAIDDPRLIEELIKRDITLEVCPTSNIAIQSYPDYQSHPFKKLMDSGVKVTLNSDDPPYFGTTIGHEYQIAKEAFGLSEEQLLYITKTAIESSFADSATKKKLLSRL